MINIHFTSSFRLSMTFLKDIVDLLFLKNKPLDTSVYCSSCHLIPVGTSRGFCYRSQENQTGASSADHGRAWRGKTHTSRI